MADTLNRDAQLAAVAALITAWGATDELALFTNDLTPAPTTVYAEFEQPVGTWYDPSDIAVVWGEPFLSAGGIVMARTQVIQYNWAAAGGATAVTVRGWVVQNAGHTAWRVAGRFASPITLSGPLNSVPVFATVAFPPVTQ